MMSFASWGLALVHAKPQAARRWRAGIAGHCTKGAPKDPNAEAAVSRKQDTAVIWKPTRAQIAAAAGKKGPDLVAAGLKVLFCGINPGLYSGAVGHHFARPGNRFWPALHAAGFTDRLLSPFEERELLPYGLGITNFVDRATATAAELTDAELAAG